MERLIAFGGAVLERVSRNGDLLLAAQTDGAPLRRFGVGAYGAYRAHLMVLIGEAVPRLDVEYAADALLSPLSAEVVLYQLRVRGMPFERLAAGWEAIARLLLNAGH